MPNTLTLITSSTVGSGGAASISFTSIPSTYTDLKLVISARTSRASDGDYIYLSLNSAQANSGRYLKGYSTVNETGTVSDNYLGIPSTNNTTSMFGNIEIYIPNYTSSSAKSIYGYTGYADTSTSASAESLGAFTWSTGSASSSAITSITLTGRFASFIQNSTTYLYGIKNS